MKEIIKKILEEEKLNKTILERKSNVDIEEIIKKIDEYDTFQDFKKENPRLYRKIKNSTQLQEHPKYLDYIESRYDRLLYLYVWKPENNYLKKPGCIRDKIVLYVGITCDEDSRFNQHVNATHDSVGGRKSAIKDYISKCGEFDIYRPVTDYITAKEAINTEKCLITTYKEKKDDYHILNKNIGGGLGGCTKNSRSILNDIQKIIGHELEGEYDFENRFPELYKHYSKNQKIRKTFNTIYGKDIFRQVNKSLKDILLLTKNHNNLDDFIKNHGEDIDKKNQINFEIIYPNENYYKNLITGEEFNSLIDVLNSVDKEYLKNEFKNEYINLYNDFLREKNLNKDVIIHSTIPIAFIPNNKTVEKFNESRNIIRKILKEELANLDQVKKGIDIAVKILKQTYPYIDGWRFDNNWNGKYIINIVIICDVKRLCEYYDSDLKPYYKNSKNFDGDAAYPVSVLKIGSDMDSNEKWESWKELNDTLNEIYKLIPEELKLLDYHNGYKRLDPDRFEFR
jgi:hypothetical protein